LPRYTESGETFASGTFYAPLLRFLGTNSIPFTAFHFIFEIISNIPLLKRAPHQEGENGFWGHFLNQNAYVIYIFIIILFRHKNSFLRHISFLYVLINPQFILLPLESREFGELKSKKDLIQFSNLLTSQQASFSFVSLQKGQQSANGKKSWHKEAKPTPIMEIGPKGEYGQRIGLARENRKVETMAIFIH